MWVFYWVMWQLEYWHGCYIRKACAVLKLLKKALYRHCEAFRPRQSMVLAAYGLQGGLLPATLPRGRNDELSWQVRNDGSGSFSELDVLQGSKATLQICLNICDFF